MPFVKLKTKKGEIVLADYDIIKGWTRIRDLIGKSELTEDYGEIIQVPFKKEILLKIIEWTTYHKDDPPHVPIELSLQNNERRTDDIPSWDKDFLKLPDYTVFKLLKASVLFGIPGLLDIVSKTIASWIKGKTADEIRKVFSVINDFVNVEEKEATDNSDWF